MQCRPWQIGPVFVSFDFITIFLTGVGKDKGKGKGKDKAIPLRAWTGPEGPRRVRLPDFKTIGT